MQTDNMKIFSALLIMSNEKIMADKSDVWCIAKSQKNSTHLKGAGGEPDILSKIKSLKVSITLKFYEIKSFGIRVRVRVWVGVF